MPKYRPKLAERNSEEHKQWLDVVELIRDIGVQNAKEVLARNPQIKYDSSEHIIESVRNNRIKTLEQLLDQTEVDLDKFEVERHVNNKWEVGAKDADGNIVVEPLFQIKAWMRVKGLEEPSRNWTDKWLDKFHTRIRHRKPVANNVSNNKPLIVVLGDLHFGYIGEDFKIIPDYNEDVCREMLDKIASIANESNRPVIVMIAGDLIESFSGKNKADTWKQITKHGMKVVLGVYDVLEEFFGKLQGFQEAYIVSGNHDRISDTNKDDPYGQVAEGVAGMFKRMGKYKVHYDELIISVPIDNINYILTHGDKRISKTKAERLIIDYGRTDMFNFIINAHFHGRAIKDDALKFRVQQIASLITGTKYEERNGWNSMSGFLIIESLDGKPYVRDYPL